MNKLITASRVYALALALAMFADKSTRAPNSQPERVDDERETASSQGNEAVCLCSTDPPAAN